jgi:hypothetical protein
MIGSRNVAMECGFPSNAVNFLSNYVTVSVSCTLLSRISHK